MKKVLFLLLVLPTLLFMVSGAFAADEDCPAGSVCIKNPLQYQEFDQLLNAILHNFFYFFAPSIAVVMFVIAGFMFVTSAGDPGRVKKAKNLALWTAIGLAIILLASGLIKVIQSIIGVTPQ